MKTCKVCLHYRECKETAKYGIVKLSICEYFAYRKSEKAILQNAIYTYGEEQQENVAVEELAELIQAICHKHRGRKSNIAEEIADCEIMIKQLKIINHCANEVKKFRCEKVNRLAERLKER